MRDSPSIDEDFTAFVAARSPALYRSAWLLTTSAPAAEDLVQSALAKVYVHWRRVQAADDPVAYVHGIVIKTFLSNRRRRSSGEIPVDVTPDRPSNDRDPTERLALMAALRTLPPSVFGILMSLEPAAAALAGMLVVSEFLSGVQWLAVGCVIVASIGATRSRPMIAEPAPD